MNHACLIDDFDVYAEGRYQYRQWREGQNEPILRTTTSLAHVAVVIKGALQVAGVLLHF